MPPAPQHCSVKLMNVANARWSEQSGVLPSERPELPSSTTEFHDE